MNANTIPTMGPGGSHLDSDAFEADDDPDDEFVFGLERTMDGIDALVRRRRRGRSQ